MLGALKKHFFNHRWAIEQCGNGQLRDEICRYVEALDQPLDMTKPLEEVEFTVFDCESTGLNPRKDRILSIGAVKVKGREIRVSSSFEALVHYSDMPDRENVAIHGILPSQSLNGIDEQDVLVQLLEYTGQNIMVAHHAWFDMTLVTQSLRKHFGIKLYNRYIDTIRLAMRLENFNRSEDQLVQKRYNLDALCLRYSIPAEERHTAVGDAYITGQLLIKLIEKARKRGIATIGELIK